MDNLKTSERLCPLRPFANGWVDVLWPLGGQDERGAVQHDGPERGRERVVADEIRPLDDGHGFGALLFCHDDDDDELALGTVTDKAVVVVVVVVGSLSLPLWCGNKTIKKKATRFIREIIPTFLVDEFCHNKEHQMIHLLPGRA